MSDPLAQARFDVAAANRILAYEGVLDAFGHVSVRHPDDPGRYLLSGSRAPELVGPADLIEYRLDSTPVEETGAAQYSERVIHGEIYRARPDVMAVCHHHAEAFMPFVITGTDYVPVFHLGAAGGAKPPFWDQRAEFGDTGLLVVEPQEGASLARALGTDHMVLMRNHGVTVTGISVQDLVFRCYYACRNAEFQARAAALGSVRPLSPGEIVAAQEIAAGATSQARAWERWMARLDRLGAMPREPGPSRRVGFRPDPSPDR